jgi:Ser-tRNA(Ala) deacylase AlaX
MTLLDYLDDTYRSQAEATLKLFRSSEANISLIFDRTIFYPKGGGQPSDTGEIVLPDNTIISVSSAEFDSSTGDVLHVISSEDIAALLLELDNHIGSICTLKISMDRRLENAKAHSAGHLIDAVINQFAPEISGKIGCHDPKQKDGCYVKFSGLLSTLPIDELINTANERIASIIGERRGISARIMDDSSAVTAGIPAKKTCRVVTIEGYPPSPCGGTHVNSFEQYHRITVTRIKVDKREKVTKVNYTFE